MNYEELKNVQKDLIEGNMGKLIYSRINEFEKKHKHGEKVCPTCGSSVDENSPYTLIFGPPDFKKKATFCALDCLDFFLQKVKTQNKIH